VHRRGVERRVKSSNGFESPASFLMFMRIR
jgi:hypothetical protein